MIITSTMIMTVTMIRYTEKNDDDHDHCNTSSARKHQACNASQLFPDSLVLSIINVVAPNFDQTVQRDSEQSWVYCNSWLMQQLTIKGM